MGYHSGTKRWYIFWDYNCRFLESNVEKLCNPDLAGQTSVASAQCVPYHAKKSMLNLLVPFVDCTPSKVKNLLKFVGVERNQRMYARYIARYLAQGINAAHMIKVLNCR
jgi:hypothetical protein